MWIEFDPREGSSGLQMVGLGGLVGRKLNMWESIQCNPSEEWH